MCFPYGNVSGVAMKKWEKNESRPVKQSTDYGHKLRDEQRNQTAEPYLHHWRARFSGHDHIRYRHDERAAYDGQPLHHNGLFGTCPGVRHQPTVLFEI